MPSMYLKMPSAAMIGLSKRGRELKELIIVVPIDCLSLLISSFEKALKSPWKSLILR